MFGGSQESAERLAAVWACVHVIASSITAMPLHLYRQSGKTRERVSDHALASLLSGQPTPAMTWSGLREMMLYSVVLRGNALWRVIWKNGRIIEIVPVDYEKPSMSDHRRLTYDIKPGNAWKLPSGSFSMPDIAHFRALSINGIEGVNPIEHCQQTTASATALTGYGKSSAEQGAPLRGIITAETHFKNADQAAQIRGRWNESYSRAAAGDGIAIFEGGDMKFHPIAMSMRDSQFIEQMNFSVEEIARIFNVPPHKIQKLDRATFNNIEHLSLEFYKGTLVPWINRIESVMNSVLLTQVDRDNGLYLRHNADGLLRGDLPSRSEAYRTLISSSVMTPNEARALEEREPLDGGDDLLAQVNQVRLRDLESITNTDPNE